MKFHQSNMYTLHALEKHLRGCTRRGRSDAKQRLMLRKLIQVTSNWVTQ
mgnify:CR=1 FL=1